MYKQEYQLALCEGPPTGCDTRLEMVVDHELIWGLF
jgi:hypothetical protein